MSLPDYTIRHPNVALGAELRLGNFVTLGEPALGEAPGLRPVTIGDRCVLLSHCVVYGGVTLGADVMLAHHVVVRESTTIGEGSRIGCYSVLGNNMTIGKGVNFHSLVALAEYGIVEDGVSLGPGVCLANSAYPRSQRSKENLEPPIVRRNARIGSNVTVLPGVEVGEGALIGANAVVSKDIPPFMVAVGNPARVIKSVYDLRLPDGGAAYAKPEAGR